MSRFFPPSLRLGHPALWQGLLGMLVFFGAWQLARTAGMLAFLPGPLEVARSVPGEIAQQGFAQSWRFSTQRVFLGFLAAAVLAIVLGIALGVSRRWHGLLFPIFEILRPIPPLAWLPLSILFWPSTEMTMVFLTFLGAFFPIFLNVLAGIERIDERYIQAARSLGGRRRTLFWQILVPGALPSLFTGLSIAIGITWEVVIAAEMASGQSGLGYLTWNAYMSHSLPGIIVGMFSIGLAGMLSSAAMLWLGRRAMPWRTH